MQTGETPLEVRFTAATEVPAAPPASPAPARALLASCLAMLIVSGVTGVLAPDAHVFAGVVWLGAIIALCAYAGVTGRGPGPRRMGARGPARWLAALGVAGAAALVIVASGPAAREHVQWQRAQVPLMLEDGARPPVMPKLHDAPERRDVGLWMHAVVAPLLLAGAAGFVGRRALGGS
jgi:hypothetical protein